jgi:ADP-heptose:LPS heptosyltransferase
MHKMDEHLMKLASLGIDPLANSRFFMPVSDQEKEYIDQLIDPEWKRMVVISPGAKSHLKRWAAVKFARLADKIVSELKCRVILVGNEDDNETMGHIMSAVTTPVKDLCCTTTIGALAELMKRSDLVITNDSAPLHVASAVNAPTLAIFGPTDERKYGPLGSKSRVIKPEKPCRPCGRALCAIGPVEGCIADITLEEVFEEARKMLG